MANTRKAKTFAYKRVEISDNQSGSTFQEYLSLALEKGKKVPDREEEFVPGSIRLLGKIKETEGYICGQLFLYEKGRNVAFIVEGDNEVEIEDVSPVDPNDKDKKREVLQGSLHFCSSGNHLIISQTSSVTSKSYETHAGWLLRDATSVLGDDSFVCLADEPTKEAKKIFEGKHVKSVNVGTPLGPVTGMDVVTEKTKKTKFSPGPDVLKAILGDRFNAKLIDDLDEANMEVTVEVKYKRSTTKKGQQYIDNVARAFRHLDPEDTLIETTDGIKLRGDKLKLTEKLTIDHYNGIPDSNQMYDGMRQWLKTLLKSGTVE